MDDGGHGCGLGSVWTPYPFGDGTGTESIRARDVLLRMAEVLIAHGVAEEDVELVLPSPRRLQVALARQRQRERDAALAADQDVCSVLLAVCPQHGDTLRPSPEGIRCSVRTCRRRWPGPRWVRHCDQPAVAVVDDPDIGERRRLCARHLAAERGESTGVPLVSTAPAPSR
ncbi:hypothetical protein [Gandjariella thermophila]|uniref:Uncharacterized protein n=1 Tax=Gandjariella thermophila TaxID=1931992 RepID=A0A4D4J550_9PSEU|nr:hypothetical protein [Gandjariella thermophila]GDY31651.1 hypothetical protein GTS_32840 [Gandjariella thermophila]